MPRSNENCLALNSWHSLLHYILDQLILTPRTLCCLISRTPCLFILHMLLSSVLLGFHYEHSDVSFSVSNQLSCPRPPDCLSLKMFYNAVFFSIFTIFSLSFGCHVCESYNHSLFPSIVNFQVFFRFLFFFFSFQTTYLLFYFNCKANCVIPCLTF